MMMRISERKPIEVPNMIPESADSGILTKRDHKLRFGLALGAGGTKGFAHIGVLQVLTEHGIVPDMVAGSSSGAIVGSVYCIGTDLKRLEQFVTGISIRQYMDFPNPFSAGLLKGDRFEELLRLLTHDKAFGETLIPFLCTAVDAELGRLDILDRGKLYRAVRASMSIPGIFRPAELDGRYYVDGGVIERVPCKALRDRGMDVVVGVDVGYQGEPVKPESMSAAEQVNQTIRIMQKEMMRYRRSQADLMLVPKVQYIRGPFQMDYAAESIAEGRRACMEALPEIIRLTGQGSLQP